MVVEYFFFTNNLISIHSKLKFDILTLNVHQNIFFIWSSFPTTLNSEYTFYLIILWYFFIHQTIFIFKKEKRLKAPERNTCDKICLNNFIPKHHPYQCYLNYSSKPFQYSLFTRHTYTHIIQHTRYDNIYIVKHLKSSYEYE